MIQPVFESDDLHVRVPVTFDETAPFSTLSGATVEAYASRPGEVVTATCSVNVPSQTITCVFNEWTFSRGLYDFHVLVTKDGSTRTVAADVISILPSAKPRP